jgi:hypothetical protein
MPMAGPTSRTTKTSGRRSRVAERAVRTKQEWTTQKRKAALFRSWKASGRLYFANVVRRKVSGLHRETTNKQERPIQRRTSVPSVILRQSGRCAGGRIRSRRLSTNACPFRGHNRAIVDGEGRDLQTNSPSPSSGMTSDSRCQESNCNRCLIRRESGSVPALWPDVAETAGVAGGGALVRPQGWGVDRPRRW